MDFIVISDDWEKTDGPWEDDEDQTCEDNDDDEEEEEEEEEEAFKDKGNKALQYVIEERKQNKCIRCLVTNQYRDRICRKCMTLEEKQAAKLMCVTCNIKHKNKGKQCQSCFIQNNTNTPDRASANKAIKVCVHVYCFFCHAYMNMQDTRKDSTSRKRPRETLPDQETQPPPKKQKAPQPPQPPQSPQPSQPPQSPQPHQTTQATQTPHQLFDDMIAEMNTCEEHMSAAVASTEAQTLHWTIKQQHMMDLWQTKQRRVDKDIKQIYKNAKKANERVTLANERTKQANDKIKQLNADADEMQTRMKKMNTAIACYETYTEERRNIRIGIEKENKKKIDAYFSQHKRSLMRMFVCRLKFQRSSIDQMIATFLSEAQTDT